MRILHAGFGGSSAPKARFGLMGGGSVDGSTVTCIGLRGSNNDVRRRPADGTAGTLWARKRRSIMVGGCNTSELIPLSAHRNHLEVRFVVLHLHEPPPLRMFRAAIPGTSIELAGVARELASAHDLLERGSESFAFPVVEERPRSVIPRRDDLPCRGVSPTPFACFFSPDSIIIHGRKISRGRR